MKITEDNFVKHLKRKNEKAMEYVIMTYGCLVKSVVSTKLNSLPNDWEDCMNEIFWAVWEHADCYKEEKGSFANWIAGVSKFKCIDYYRKHKKHHEYENVDDMEIPSKEMVEDRVQQEWMEEEFENMISCLSDFDKEVFRKRFWEEKDMDEVSMETGMKKENLYNHVSKGRKKLKKCWDRRFEREV